VKNHPASYLTPTLLNNLSYELDATEIETFISGLDTTVAKVTIIKDLKTRVAVMKTVAIGQKAPDFTLNDVNDKPLPLSSKIGKSKLLLVDFWASWCGPCRAENPNVVKVWKEFNKKGFDIFSVSLDQEGAKDKWMQAIKDDKLTWTHVSDLKYWSCAAAKLYAVNSIPANFLLDDKGTIIAKNLRGDDLYNKVKELLAPAKKK
jgi:peroxiredoxin